MNQTNSQPVTIDQRYRTLIILWFGIFMSLVIYLVFIHFLPAKVVPNQKLTLLLNSLGLIPVATSFLIKQVLLGRAIESQAVQQVHAAYIIAWALCEIAGLLAFIDSRVTGSPYYYLGFAVGGLGLLLHFPRKQHLLEASPQ
jgi:hypothetical protein